MPLAICDSEDEEEEVLVEDEYPSQRSRSSGVLYDATIELANQILSGSPGRDGTNDKSSLSTGEINRQIADTTRAFFSSTTSKMAAAPASPTKQKLSRRHTNVNGSAPSANPPKTVKRTMTTYGKSGAKSQRAPKPASEGAFDALRNDERASQESVSAAFLQHSDPPKPTHGLPAGTILQAFQEHDPHALFPNTGSTIVNNESSMQRMLEMARESAPQLETTAHMSSHGSQAQQSSPFAAWSASEKQTQTPKVDSHKHSPLQTITAANTSSSAAATPVDNVDQHIGNGTPMVNDVPAVVVHEHSATTAAKQGTSQQSAPSGPIVPQQSGQDNVIASINAQHEPSISKAPPKSSPMVIIPPAGTPPANESNSEQRTARGRKRKSMGADPIQALLPSSDSLNPEDHALGLPKELYKPRPSRRRATAIAEPVDYSVVPERALKKRRKTVDDDRGESAGDSSELPRAKAKSSINSQAKVAQRDGLDAPTPMPKTRQNPGQDEDADLKAAIAASLRDMEQSTVNESMVIEDDKSSAATPTTAKPAGWHEPARPEASPLSPESVNSKPSSATRISDRVSPMKMLPPSLPASATRKTPRRSQTTIFEDHAAQRSPSLSQQQANRMALVKNVPKPTQTGKQKRRTIIQDVDEEEDELAKESPVQKPAPKKRGRSSKAEIAAIAKASRRVLVESDDESIESEVNIPTRRERQAQSTHAVPANTATEDREDAIEIPSKKGKKAKSSAKVSNDSADELEMQEGTEVATQPAKKKGSSRPSKSAAKVLEDSEEEPVLDDDDEDSDAKPNKNKGPCRPSKRKSQANSKADDTTALSKPGPLEPKDVNANTAAKRAVSTSKEPTPMPSTEPQVSNHEANPTIPALDVKPSPTTHSPIKKNAKVIHRVGLGRRQRVQPLLKMIRPEARARKEDATRVTTITSVAELERKWSEVPE